MHRCLQLLFIFYICLHISIQILGGFGWQEIFAINVYICSIQCLAHSRHSINAFRTNLSPYMVLMNNIKLSLGSYSEIRMSSIWHQNSKITLFLVFVESQGFFENSILQGWKIVVWLIDSLIYLCLCSHRPEIPDFDCESLCFYMENLCLIKNCFSFTIYFQSKPYVFKEKHVWIT